MENHGHFKTPLLSPHMENYTCKKQAKTQAENHGKTTRVNKTMKTTHVKNNKNNTKTNPKNPAVFQYINIRIFIYWKTAGFLGFVFVLFLLFFTCVVFMVLFTRVVFPWFSA
jgi:hypothetical protein